MSDFAEKLIKRKNKLAAIRQKYESNWQECYDYSFPMRNTGFNSLIADIDTVRNKKAALLDPTATDGSRILASSIIGGMTPANLRWFGLDVHNAQDDGKRWLDDSATRQWKQIHASNYDSAAFEGFIDSAVVGWFPLYIDEDREKGGLNFELWPIAQVYCAASKSNGIIDIVFREYTLTAEQCVNEFGEENVSERVKNAVRSGREDEDVKLIHAIYPRSKNEKVGIRAKNLPFASYHVEIDGKKVVRESGYHEFPVAVPRWMKLPGSVYATGPMQDVLPFVKSLNEYTDKDMSAADINIAGMWIAEDDGVLNPRTVKIGPRKIIVANSTDSMKPLMSASNFQLADTRIAQLQQAIRHMLMADQLLPQDGPARTATEVYERVKLIRQLLGPIYGRMQVEYAQQVVLRSFGLCYRGGLFAPIPQSLAGQEFRVTYLSPLAKSQKFEEVTAITNTLNIAAGLTQIYPEVMDNFDIDEAIRTISDGNGMPSSLLRAEVDWDDMREQRAQAQAEAAQQEQQAALAAQAIPELIKQQAAA